MPRVSSHAHPPADAVPADNSTQLLVAVGEDLALLDVRTQAYRPLLSTETEPRALVYDLLRETYYWLTEEGELCAHHPGKGARLLYAGAETQRWWG